jgi:cell division protein FtsB
LTVAAVVVLLLVALGGVRRHQELESARAREQLLNERILETRRELAELESFLEDLRDDPRALERAARKQLNMVQSDEVVFIFDTEDADPS